MHSRCSSIKRIVLTTPSWSSSSHSAHQTHTTHSLLCTRCIILQFHHDQISSQGVTTYLFYRSSKTAQLTNVHKNCRVTAHFKLEFPKNCATLILTFSRHSGILERYTFLRDPHRSLFFCLFSSQHIHHPRIRKTSRFGVGNGTHA
jgi:hypothetical protein